MQLEELGGLVGQVRRAARRAEEEHGAQPVQIGARVDRSVEHPGLLGSHISRRAHDRSPLGSLLGALDEAEVDEVRVAVVVDEDIDRRDVAMDQSAPVNPGERAGDREAELDQLVGRQRPVLGHGSTQGAPLQVLEHDVGQTLSLADGVDARQRGVVQTGQDRRLSGEALPLGVVELLGRAQRQFDGDRIDSVAGTVDDAVRAATELFVEMEAGEIGGERRMMTHQNSVGGSRRRLEERRPLGRNIGTMSKCF